jgi:hypothetical protein
MRRQPVSLGAELDERLFIRRGPASHSSLHDINCVCSTSPPLQGPTAAQNLAGRFPRAHRT